VHFDFLHVVTKYADSCGLLRFTHINGNDGEHHEKKTESNEKLEVNLLE